MIERERFGLMQVMRGRRREAPPTENRVRVSGFGFPENQSRWAPGQARGDEGARLRGRGFEMPDIAGAIPGAWR